MNVLVQNPQPIISCYSSIRDGEFNKNLYQIFSPSSNNVSGKNLQSYNFSRDLNDIAGSFSFTVVEDVNVIGYENLFMDKVKHLDVITISEQGNKKIDFIGVVTTISVGGIASNLTKQVTVSGKSIFYLFQYLNIYADLKALAFENTSKNIELVLSLNQKKDNKTVGTSIKFIATTAYNEFIRVLTDSGKNVSNVLVLSIIKSWLGESDSFIVVPNDEDNFTFPITSNMFSSGTINYIDFIRQLLPQPVYEIYGFIDDDNKPKLKIRTVPFSKKPFTGEYNRDVVKINPTLITNFTLTKSCEEVYTAFLPYIEGSSMSPEFYMSLIGANNKLTNEQYAQSISNPDKVKKYGFQVLMCNFVGFDPMGKLNTEGLQKLTNNLKKWYSDIDEMLNGDLTIVNFIGKSESVNIHWCTIGNWLYFSGGSFYIQAENHSWNYGDNPMINYSLIRGGEYIKNGDSDFNFKPLEKMSAFYKELE